MMAISEDDIKVLIEFDPAAELGLTSRQMEECDLHLADYIDWTRLLNDHALCVIREKIQQAQEQAEA